MSYRTFLLPLQLGRSNTTLLQFAAELARRLDADVGGVTGFQPTQIVYGDGSAGSERLAAEMDEIDREITEAEAAFRRALGSRVAEPAWRAMRRCPSLAHYFAVESRSTDMIVSAVADTGGIDVARSVNLGELILQAGRPVLLVPQRYSMPSLLHALVAWKDTREARRALSDALPVLRLARRITLVEIMDKDASAEARHDLEDMLAWLGQYGIQAEAIAVPATGDDAETLRRLVDELGVDLLVAGAYGHSRLREWALGGVTRDLLLNPACCAMVSH